MIYDLTGQSKSYSYTAPLATALVSAHKRMMTSMKQILKAHTNKNGGTRKTVEQVTVDALILGICWDVENNKECGREISRILKVDQILIMQKMKEAKEIQQSAQQFQLKK